MVKFTRHLSLIEVEGAYSGCGPQLSAVASWLSEWQGNAVIKLPRRLQLICR